jgi:hypothetical protein
MIKRLIGRAAVWAGRRRPGEAARAGEDPCVEREIAASLTDEALAWAVGTWQALPMTAVTGVDSCDITLGGVGTATAGSCRYKSASGVVGRLDKGGVASHSTSPRKGTTPQINSGIQRT